MAGIFHQYLRYRNTLALTSFTSADGLAIVVDYWHVREQDGVLRQYVHAANRHREIQMQIGSPWVRVWKVDHETGEKIEQQPVLIDSPRFTPDIRISYDDRITRADLDAAEALAEGARAAYYKGVLTAREVYFLGDYGAFIEAAEAANMEWPNANPWAYIRFLQLKLLAEIGGPLGYREYVAIANTASAFTGAFFTPEEIRQIGRDGEKNMEIVARTFNLQEGGYSREAGEWIDFREYNRLKRENPNWNGPDAIYTRNDEQGVISATTPSNRRPPCDRGSPLHGMRRTHRSSLRSSDWPAGETRESPSP